MKIKYIIVQAGGKGTRLGYLTKNRPKAIVPINNKPIIFHLFEKYPEAYYIIIGDYKYNVLEAFLENFSKIQYVLIHAEGEGNVCGIRRAISYIPEDEPFMLIWSDLILDKDFNIKNLIKKNYVGITNLFPCSWCFNNNQLIKRTTKTNGVAGLFLFESKCILKALPDCGSFTKWCAQNNIKFSKLHLKNSREVGTLEVYKELDHSNQHRCRPYNQLIFEENLVTKFGLTEEGKALIKREVEWYKAVSKDNFKRIPRIISFEPLMMSRINGDNIFKATLDDEQKRKTIDNLIVALNELHHIHKQKVNIFDMQEDYYTKTMKRLYSIRTVIPFAEQPYIRINGIECKNIFFFHSDLQCMVNNILNAPAEFGIIHGDGTLTNTLIDDFGNIYFIDARGYFGKTPLVGDVYYDWAKLYYSIQGSFDQFNIKKFNLVISDSDVSYSIQKSGWEHLTEYLLDKIPNCDKFRIRLIHAIIWLSLASHCWEDYDSMCLAFYNGLYLWNELIHER